MLKKFLLHTIVFTLILSFPLESIFAYDYVEKKNEEVSEKMIEEVYDRRQQYKDFIGETEEDETEFIENVNNDYYWWPIGSSEIQTQNGKEFASDEPETVTITSNYGYRSDPFGSGASLFHSGLDIAGGRGLGSVNIIAAKDGTVVYSSKGGTVCTSGSQQSSCGGGYGNYIIIQHTDGNYTLYAHLYENSLTVSEGDSVKQGQVIAKMGSSGNSTGAHLHFEVREGQNVSSATVDPLNYIDPENPRPVNTSGDFLDFLATLEGDTGITPNGEYIIINIGDGVRTVGHGVTLENNADNFARRGVDINNYSTGDTLPINMVDAVEVEIIDEIRSYIESTLADNGITLKQNQIEALISMQYNCGAGSTIDFIEQYKKYGDTEDLRQNFFLQWVSRGSIYEEGLTNRRESEWNLFHNGIYDILK